MALLNQRVVYLNGELIPESEARLPFRDRGVKYGDAVFDTTRTFGHKIFKLREHLERLYRSLRYLRIDPGLSIDEMAAITEDVVSRNLHLIDTDEDYWVSHRITRGIIDPNDRYRRVPAAAAAGPREALPRRHRRHGSRDPANRAGHAESARKDPQLPEPDTRGSRGAGTEPGSVRRFARRKWQSV